MDLCVYKRRTPFPLTLPLSGRQEAAAGEAESGRWPVHSKGLFEGLLAANPQGQATSINSFTTTDVFSSASPRTPEEKHPSLKESQ